MRLFSRKIDQVSTEEQRYQAAASEQAAEGDRKARYDAVNQAASEHYRRQREAREKKNGRIKKVGEIKRVGRGKYVTTGWEIDVPDGSGRGRVAEEGVHHSGQLGGFTPAELCAIAHGPRCRKCC